jgi:hypothetical protein
VPSTRLSVSAKVGRRPDAELTRAEAIKNATEEQVTGLVLLPGVTWMTEVSFI